MTIEFITSLIIALCPNLKAMNDKFVIQNEKVTCMEYYTNDIVNHPSKYKR